MIQVLQKLLVESGESKYRIRELESRVYEHIHDSRIMFEYCRLMFEASEDLYQERLERIAPFIKELTLAQVESLRFATDTQWHTLLTKYEVL